MSQLRQQSILNVTFKAQMTDHLKETTNTAENTGDLEVERKNEHQDKCDKNREPTSEEKGLRRSSVQSRKHSYFQLHGASTSDQIKGHHDEGQLKGSLLERRGSTKIVQELAQARGSLKTPPTNLDCLTENTESPGTGSGDVICDAEIKKGVEQSDMYPNGLNSTTGVVITQPSSLASPVLFGSTVTAPLEGNGALKPKPRLQRRKSLNPRMMTPPGLEILDNMALLAVRQQMEMDIKSKYFNYNSSV